MRGIKLAAIDLDGTLLRNDCTITDRTQKAVETAIHRGIKVVPTTGRVYNNAKKVCGIIAGIRYYINSNGTIVADGDTDKILRCIKIPSEITRKVVEICHNSDVFYEMYMGLDSYVEEAKVAQIYRTGEPKVYCDQIISMIQRIEKISEFLKKNCGDVNKFHIMCRRIEERLRLEEQIKQIPEISVITVTGTNLEVVCKGESKKNAVEWLGKYLGIEREEMLTIGDGMNDYEMLEYAGYSAAMGNAPDQIQKLASRVIDSNEEDGVAKLLEELERNCVSLFTKIL